MRFRSEINIAKQQNTIDYHSKILSFGSCFAVNMHEKFNYYKFNSSCNPFRILFHPVAIENLISFAVSDFVFTEKDIFYNNERWNSFHAHSDLSNTSDIELLKIINKELKFTKKALTEASFIIITYGTAWVYRHLEQNFVVANCHKLPQHHFEKELLDAGSIRQSISRTVSAIGKINPLCKIIFTISPVRHLKDGFVENQWSKSNLISALQTEIKNIENATYFPSYEIMMDDLRDYRFYSDDFVHPNQLAIDYIWKKFVDSNINENAFHTMTKVEDIQRRLQHRPFNPNSISYKTFGEELKTRIKNLQQEFPFMDF